MKVLGIESSCDDTSVAVVSSDRTVIAHKTISDLNMHQKFGGVVPEIASRSHMRNMETLVTEVMSDANMTLDEIDGIAVTGGPGLIGGVMVGVSMAKAIASVSQKPFIAINHLEGHALTCRLTDNIEYPYLLLLISGGHSQIISVRKHGNYRLLGTTIDDALGECFDKTGRMLGFEYPGGPKIEKHALGGNENYFVLPKPLINENNCNFSFSGLKTAVLRTLEKGNIKDKDVVQNMCASFQKTIVDVLENRLSNAISLYEKDLSDNGTDLKKQIVISGGVAANQYIKKRLSNMMAQENYSIVSPPLSLCTDNGAMIAWAGIERLQKGEKTDMQFNPRSVWPLSEL